MYEYIHEIYKYILKFFPFIGFYVINYDASPSDQLKSDTCFSSDPCEAGWKFFDDHCYLYMNNGPSRYNDIEVCR